MPDDGRVVHIYGHDRTARSLAPATGATGVVGRIVPSSPERQVRAVLASERKLLAGPRTAIPPDLGALLGS